MKKNTYILGALFVVLLLIAFLVLQKPGEQSASSASTGTMFSIDSLSVDKIEIKATNSTVVLEKRGSEWFVAQPINYKADQATVGQCIHQVKVLEVKSIVSSKPEKHSVFQVDTAGISVRLFEKGTKESAFILGKMAGGYSEYYVRKANTDDVLLSEGAYSYSFNRALKDWRDKSIMTIPKESITDIRYQYGDTTFIVAMKDSVWRVNNDRAQQSVVDGILTSLSNFQADDFIDSSLAPKVMATIVYANVQIRFSFDKSANKYYVQSSNSPQWYVVEQWKANQVLKRKKEIVEAVKK
jgi:hypothetical protein